MPAATSGCRPQAAGRCHGAPDFAWRRWHTGRPSARCLWFRSFSGGPRSEPDGCLSTHPALQRFSRAVRGWLPVVDGLVAGCADDEGLAPHFRHQGRPGGLLAAWPYQVGELSDLVAFHRGPGVAPFAFAVQEPGDDLPRARGRCWLAVGDDRFLLPFERDAAEPCGQWLPARPFLAA